MQHERSSLGRVPVRVLANQKVSDAQPSAIHSPICRLHLLLCLFISSFHTFSTRLTIVTCTTVVNTLRTRTGYSVVTSLAYRIWNVAISTSTKATSLLFTCHGSRWIDSQHYHSHWRCNVSRVDGLSDLGASRCAASVCSDCPKRNQRLQSNPATCTIRSRKPPRNHPRLYRQGDNNLSWPSRSFTGGIHWLPA
ncbi:hypothetical protein M3J09_005334 [Ascochyta lentis]